MNREGVRLSVDVLSELRKQVKLSTSTFSDESSDTYRLDLLHHRSFEYKEETLPVAILIDDIKYQRIKELPKPSFMTNGSPSIMTSSFIEIIKEQVLPDFNKKYEIEKEIHRLTKQIVDGI